MTSGVVVTNKRVIAICSTKQGFRYACEAYVLTGMPPQLLGTQIARRGIPKLTTEIARLRAKEGRYARATQGQWRIGTLESGVIHSAAGRFKSQAAIAARDFNLIEWKGSSVDPVVYASKITRLAALPWARLPIRFVRLDEGWYGMGGVVVGPFDTKEDARIAIVIARGEDPNDD